MSATDYFGVVAAIYIAPCLTNGWRMVCATVAIVCMVVSKLA